MIWLYILIYFLGAIITGLLVYISLIKKYIKENTALKFGVWIENYISYIFIYALFWFIVLLIGPSVGIDWLNKNHFDYRGLIEKGLAINATNLNIY